MSKKPNPILAAYEAKKEAEFQGRLQRNSEIDIIALLIAAHNELKVGPGRAGYLLAEFLDVKMQLAGQLLADVGDGDKRDGNGDPEFLHTKRDWATALQKILGPENWEKYRELFPVCREYWEVKA